ncbi:MAG: lipopolysaccharide biosynthesis protein, partial [Pseudomonadota bacterium]
MRLMQPSHLMRALIPSLVANRWPKQVAKGLEIADTVATGTDDTARAQRTALMAFSIRIASAFIAYVSQILIARWLGSHEYGVFVWVWVAAVICGGISCIGFPSAVIRFIPQYRVEGNLPAMRGIIVGSRLFAVAAATGLAVIGCVLVWLLGDVVSNI